MEKVSEEEPVNAAGLGKPEEQLEASGHHRERGEGHAVSSPLRSHVVPGMW